MAGVLDLMDMVDGGLTHRGREDDGSHTCASHADAHRQPPLFAYVLPPKETEMLSGGRKAQAVSTKKVAKKKKPKAKEESQKLASKMQAEKNEGNEEYKLKVCNVSYGRFQKLTTQLLYRLNEGGGTAYYYLGVEDDGTLKGLSTSELNASIETLLDMASYLNARAEVEQILDGLEGKYAKVMVKMQPTMHSCTYRELRVALCGSAGSGKSTLLSVLTHGTEGEPLLDNGNGGARSRVFKHKHEVESGRTSSISMQTLAYGKNGAVLNYSSSSTCWPLTPIELSRAAGKMIRLFDLSGHQRYMKTTAYGMTCLVPDFSGLCIAANEGMMDMTREHAAIATALHSPLFIVITKIDGCPKEHIDAVIQQIRNVLQNHNVRVLQSVEEGLDLGKQFSKHEASFLPVFLVSNLTGAGVGILHAFLKKLKPRWQRKDSSDGFTERLIEPVKRPPHFQVQKTFEVPQVGGVLFGTLLSGRIKVGNQLLLGPMEDGRFDHVKVKSIQRSKVPVNKLYAGQTGTLAVEFAPNAVADQDCADADNAQRSEPCPIPKSQMRRHKQYALHSQESNGFGSSPPCKKGTVLVDSQLNPSSSHTFRGIVTVLTDSFTLRASGSDSDSECEEACSLASALEGRTMVVHCGSTRQAAEVLKAERRAYKSNSHPFSSLDMIDVCADPNGDDSLNSVYSEPLQMDFKFLHWPEWMKKGTKLVLRNQLNGRLSGVGYVC